MNSQVWLRVDRRSGEVDLYGSRLDAEATGTHYRNLFDIKGPVEAPYPVVFVVLYFEYEGTDVVGVYATYAGAVARIRGKSSMDYDIEVWELKP